MKKIDLMNGLQILANLAVIAGIVVLVFELRQTNSAIQAASIQAASTSTGEALRLVAADDDLANIRRRGNADPATLDPDEAERYRAWNRQFWVGFQNQFIQRNIGALEAQVWDSYGRIICSSMGNPGVRATWSDHAPVLDTEFVVFVESCEQF